jgi:BA14K-like protein
MQKTIAAFVVICSEVSHEKISVRRHSSRRVRTALAMASALPGSAQLARPQTVIDVRADSDLLTKVQYRRGYYRGGYCRGYRRGWGGLGVGLGIGLAAGALIGGALTAPYYYGTAPGAYYGAPGDSVAYCMQRFQSYDPASGTYLGYDGLRHPVREARLVV